MAKVFILPDGKQVRAGQAATVARKMARVEPAKTKRDDDGNERIVTPAREVVEKQAFIANYASLSGMKPRELELFGVSVAEAGPEPDPRFYGASDGPVKNGVATRTATPLPLRQVKDDLARQVKARTDMKIATRISQSDQLNEAVRRVELTEIAATRNLDAKETAERKALQANRAWIDGVLAQSRNLQRQVAGLKTVKAAAQFAAKAIGRNDDQP